ncbi:hypothetical protein MAR_013850, partial [Mya arenaria]
VRQTARSVVIRKAMTIAENALLENSGPDDVGRPKKNLLKRVANRARSKLRPEEPKGLDFELDGSFINKDDFLVADIQMESQRHFVFVTEYQLSLLRDAKRWYIDGTFKLTSHSDEMANFFSIHAFIEKAGQLKHSRRTKVDYASNLESIKERIGTASVEGFVADYEQGWHHRINSKAECAGLGFYRLVPLLRREAESVKLAVDGGDLDRRSSKISTQMDKSINERSEQYLEGTLQTSQFLQTVGGIY